MPVVARHAVHEHVHGLVAVPAHRFPAGHGQHRDIPQRAPDATVGALGVGRGHQEPPDQRQPQPAQVAGDEHLSGAGEQEHQAEHHATLGGGTRGGGPVAAPPPQRGAQHPPAVQRCTGQQVERGQQQVHLGEPGQRTGQDPIGVHRPGRERRRAEHRAAHGAGQRSGERHEQLTESRPFARPHGAPRALLSRARRAAKRSLATGSAAVGGRCRSCGRA